MAKFKPGQSGNPKGRPPKEWTMAGLIRTAMEETNGDAEEKKHYVARALVDKAMDGDVMAIREINNRIDGAPAQAVDLTTQGEKLEAPRVIINTQEKT